MLNKYFCLKLSSAGLLIGWVGIMISIIFGIEASILINKLMIARDDPIPPLICGLVLGMILIFLISSVILIIGVIKENRIMLMPWLITDGIALVCVSVIIICTSTNNTPIGVPIVFTLLLLLKLYTYFAMCVLYKSINNNARLLEHESA